MIQIDLQPAYLLHARAYRDTSVLADLLTLDYGLIRAVARGARGRRRRFLLQQHQPLLVSCRGRGELLTLTHAEHAAPGFFLRDDWLFSALYLNELLERVLPPHESFPEIYRLYQHALLKLQQQSALEPVLRTFEWQLLATLGYWPDLTSVKETACYIWQSDAGLVPVSPDTPGAFSGAALAGLQVFLSAQHNQALAVNEPGTMQQVDLVIAKRLMRQMLRPLLGSRPLMSRALFSARLVGQSRLPPDANTG